MNRLESWIPEKTQRPVVAAIQSGIYSFTVCALVSRGDLTASITSAAFAILACIVYMVARTVFQSLETQLKISSEGSYLANRLFVFTGINTLFITQKLGYNCSFISLLISLTLYSPNHLKKSPGSVPVFAIIAYKIRTT